MLDLESKKGFQELASEYIVVSINPVRCGKRNKSESHLLELGHLTARPAAGGDLAEC